MNTWQVALLQLLLLRVNNIVRYRGTYRDLDQKRCYPQCKLDYAVLDKWLLESPCHIFSGRVHWQETKSYLIVCGDIFFFCQAKKNLICYSVITMYVCIHEQRGEIGERKRRTKDYFHFQVWSTPYLSLIRCAISFFSFLLFVMLPLISLPCLEVVGTLNAMLAAVVVAWKIKWRNCEHVTVTALI